MIIQALLLTISINGHGTAYVADQMAFGSKYQCEERLDWMEFTTSRYENESYTCIDVPPPPPPPVAKIEISPEALLFGTIFNEIFKGGR